MIMMKLSIFFREYLNHYAYQYLDHAETEKWQELSMQDEQCFTKIFGADKLDEMVFSEFLDYFLIRKVMGGKYCMKKSVRVMKKLSSWLKEKQYTDEDYKEYFKEASDLPNVGELAELIYEHAMKSPEKEYDEILDGYFSVLHLENKKLWLEEELGDGTNIGPVFVSKEISDLCKPGWTLNLVIGKDKTGWYILESGNVYR